MIRKRKKIERSTVFHSTIKEMMQVPIFQYANWPK